MPCTHSPCVARCALKDLIASSGVAQEEDTPCALPAFRLRGAEVSGGMQPLPSPGSAAITRAEGSGVLQHTASHRSKSQHKRGTWHPKHAVVFLLVKPSQADGFSYGFSIKDTVNSRSITALKYDNPTWLNMLFFTWRGINNRRFTCK